MSCTVSTQLFNEWRTVYLFYKRILTSLLVFFMLTTIYASNQQRVPQNSVSLNESVPRGPFFHVSNLNSDLQTHDGTLELERPRPNFRMKRKPKVLPERLFTKRRRLERNTTNDALNLQSFVNGIQLIPVETKNEGQFTSNPKAVFTTTRFRLVCHSKTYTEEVGEETKFFKHLQNNLASLTPQKGKLEFCETKSSNKDINLPDLSYEAVKSFTLAIESRIDVPPTQMQYQLATTIPANEKEQKKLLIQIAQMVCVAIRLKFEEMKFFSLLDWYKMSMNGVWENLLRGGDGNECVKEVEEARISIQSDLKQFDEVRKEIFEQPIAQPVFQNLAQEKHFDGEKSLQNAIDSVTNFRIEPKNSTSLIHVKDTTGDLFPHLKETFWKLKVQEGKMEFVISLGTFSKKLCLPDLSWEAVRSYVAVTKLGLRDQNAPPQKNDYKLARNVPENEEEQKELMIQVAQMVCVAIRFKFDEVKLLSLLDWYKAGMEGVWEQLLQSEDGNECAREVEEFRDSIAVAQIAL